MKIKDIFGIIGAILGILTFLGISFKDLGIVELTPIFSFIGANPYWFSLMSLSLIIIWLILRLPRAINKPIKSEIKNAHKKVRFFLPSTESHRFWSTLVVHLQSEAGKDSRDIHIIPEFLNEHYSYDEQKQKLEDKNKWDDIDAAIVCPTKDKILDIIIDLILKNKKIIIHDVSEEKLFYYFALLDKRVPKFVAIDNYLGGTYAADIMYEFLKLKSTNGFDILLVHGEKTQSHSHQRILGFISRMQELAQNDIAVYYTNEGMWQYEKAKEEFKRFIKENIIIKSNKRNILGIFACNDDMALAIDDHLKSENIDGFKDVIIVGFDKTPDMENLESRGNPTHIIGTVDSKIEKQAKLLYKSIVDTIEENEDSSNNDLIKPSAFKFKEVV